MRRITQDEDSLREADHSYRLSTQVISGEEVNTEEDGNDEEARELDNCTKVLGLKKAENEDQDQNEIYTLSQRTTDSKEGN